MCLPTTSGCDWDFHTRISWSGWICLLLKDFPGLKDGERIRQRLAEKITPENILAEVPCRLAITDQFGDKRYVLDALMQKGRTIELVQQPRAEEDLAVAAASILARAEFLKRLHFLSKEMGLDLPKGASSMVEEAGIRLVKLHGPAILDRAAKMHFKTTERVLSGAG